MRNFFAATTALALVFSTSARGAYNAPPVGPADNTTVLGRTLATRAQDIVYAADYGVRCDAGTTDNATPFANLSTAINTLGGNVAVVFPKGTCVSQSTGMSFTGSGIRLFGPGTKIQMNSATAEAVKFAPSSPSTTSAYQNGIDGLYFFNSSGNAVSSSVAIHLVRQVSFWTRGVQAQSFYGGVLMEGGSDEHLDGLSITAGSGWSALKSGSYLVNLVPAVYGSVNEHPSEVFFANPNWKGTPYVDNALNIQSVDGVWFTGGHLGFSNHAVRLAPIQASEGIQGVYFGGTYLDGNNQAGTTGLFIPAFSASNSNTGRFILNVQFSGSGQIANFKAKAFDLQEPTAGVIDVATQYIANNTTVFSAVGSQFNVSFNTFQSNGSSSIAATYTGTAIGNKFANATATPCFTLSGSPYEIFANTTDGNCTLPQEVLANQVTLPGVATSGSIALLVAQNSAIRDATNGASAMNFDVSTGGTATGSFVWRTSSSFTTLMSLTATGLSIPGLLTTGGGALMNLAGGTPPATPVTPGWQIVSASSARGYIDSFANSSSVVMRRTDGTVAAPAALASGDAIGDVSFSGYDGSTYSTSSTTAKLTAAATQAWTTTTHGEQIQILTVPNGTTASAVALTLGQDQSAAFTGIVSTKQHFAGTGSAPTVTTSAGTATPSAGINDNHGTINQSAAGTVTIKFASAYTNAPDCTVDAQNGSSTTYSTTGGAVGTANLAVTLTAAAKFTYICMGQ